MTPPDIANEPAKNVQATPSESPMSALKVAAALSFFGAVVCTSACKHHHHRRDTSTDPVEPSDGGTCSEAGCVDADAQGVTVIQTEFNDCPHVSMEVTPVQARVDQQILVTSRSIDPEGDALTHEWSVDPDGAFDKADSPVTYYRCQSLGRKMLHLIVTDARGCDSADDVEVSCVSVDEFIRSGMSRVGGL